MAFQQTLTIGSSERLWSASEAVEDGDALLEIAQEMHELASKLFTERVQAHPEGEKLVQAGAMVQRLD